MNKPMIIALCGKSAVGKDCTAQGLCNALNRSGNAAAVIVSDTTRPPREGEREGYSYRFIDKDTFIEELKRNNYIEHAEFRGWYYGTHYTEINFDKINIGVFNIDGLNQLYDLRREFDIAVFYLKDRWGDRLRRSRDREGRWRLEYFRRLFVDWVHFLGINKVLRKFRYNKTIENKNGVVRKTRCITHALMDGRMIAVGQNPII